MKKRNLFAEICEGFEALKLARELEATSHERLSEAAPPPASRRSSPVRIHGIGTVKVRLKKWL